MSLHPVPGCFEIPALVRESMRGRSWRDLPDCPRFEELRLLRLRHYGFDGRVHPGELVVNAALADEVFEIFERIFAAAFPIESLRRIDDYEADDEASMAANNSSGFNFRLIDGTATLSQHAQGRAIDINPLQNPWLRGPRVDPAAGRDYLDRTQVRPGMIVRPGPVVEAFERAGWAWGGDLAQPDYHHFSKAARSS
jgi:D-alanyl-D-alanine carboxypeptidase